MAAIAGGLGFLDPSSFSRSFKKEFGLTPKDVMHATLSGIPMDAVAVNARDSEVRSLRDLLSQIAQR
ncbi:Bacterial regulatory helix-turn-helix protein, AraC family [compost metagenome]